MTDLILAIPAWLTDAVLEMSIYILCVAIASVLSRVAAEWFTPVMPDDDDDEEIVGNGMLPEDAF